MIAEGTLVINIRPGDEILTSTGRARVTTVSTVGLFILVKMDIKDKAERTWFYSHEYAAKVVEG